MFKEFFLFELKYRARHVDSYFYFFVLFLFSIISTDFIFEGQLKTVAVNSPIIIARTMGIVSALFLMIVSMTAGTSILRDYTQNTHVLLFSFPFTKAQYIVGRFTGSFATVVIIFIALPLGLMIAPLLPWNDPADTLPFHLWAYVQPFLWLTIPTLFFSSALFFVTGLLTQKLLLVYIQGFFFLLIYLLSLNLAVGSESLFLTSLIEPFTFQTIRIVTASWSMAERTSAMLPMEGVLLANRFLWLLFGFITLGVGYLRFKLDTNTAVSKKNNKRLEKVEPEQAIERSATNFIVDATPSSIQQLVHHTVFNLRLIVSDISFRAILLCAIGILLINGFSLGTDFGIDNLPTTYIIVGELVELTFFFFIGIILFYSGELMWKERDVHFDAISDSAPVRNWVQLTGKFLGLLVLLIILMGLMIATGIGFQAAHGYFDFELEVYLMAFFVEIFPYLTLISLVSFTGQAFLNHKYAAHIATMVFLMVITAGFIALEITHDLLFFGGSVLPRYSDMNGFSYLMPSYLLVKSYWLMICAVAFVLVMALLPHGSETGFLHRIRAFRNAYTSELKWTSFILLVGIIGSGGFIFYHTNIANNYFSADNELQLRADYENTFSFIQQLPHPEMESVFLELSLYPSDLYYELNGQIQLVNRTPDSISFFYIQKLPSEQVSLEFPPQSVLQEIDQTEAEVGLYKLLLSKPMLPGESIQVAFEQQFRTQKIGADFSPYLLKNGSMIDDYHLPSIGYLDDIEISDPNIRADFGLPVKKAKALITDAFAMKTGKANGNGEYIDFELVVSTDEHQIAVAPGKLINAWKESGRAFFHYKSDLKISNLISITSAEYEVYESGFSADEASDSVRLEIYYHPGHEFNIDQMMVGMKNSLKYFTAHFSVYQFDHLRIVEVPIYHNRAQSIPGMITVAENMGFTLDTASEQVPDLPYFITAHEVAHQWWGDQVNAADVQGQLMIAETLAQYSALMVFKQQYGEEMTNELLKWNMRQYFKNRLQSDMEEPPLYLVESGQDYLYYRKGLIVMNALEQLISEESINRALSTFIKDWNSKNGIQRLIQDRFPVSTDLLNIIYAETPDSLKARVSELFESVMVYKNKVNTVKATETNSGEFRLSVDIELEKIDESDAKLPVKKEFSQPIQIGFYSTKSNGEKALIAMEWISAKPGPQIIEVTFPRKPDVVILDPTMTLLDNNILDNRMEVEWE